MHSVHWQPHISTFCAIHAVVESCFPARIQLVILLGVLVTTTLIDFTIFGLGTVGAPVQPTGTGSI